MQLNYKLLKKISIVSVLLLIIAVSDLFYFLHSPMQLDSEFLYELKSGASVSSLTRDLKKQQMLSRPFYFSIWPRVTGQARKLQAGEYKITPGMTPRTLLENIVNGRVQQYSLTLVEGWTFWQVMDQVNNSPDLKHQLTDLSDKQIMQKIGHAGEHPEGMFYPDTYHFPKGLEDTQFLQRAYDAMQEKLKITWKQRDVGLPFKQAYDALIMASIVEKESALASERTRIAGVFINRLNKRMRLQTDPTVIYGLGRNFDGDIRFRDLRRDTPYNTYTRRGLPPTPIAMPGQGAIEAVMNPDKTPYLFFVARGDASGSHVFTETLAEHEKAVNKYQRKRRKKR